MRSIRSCLESQQRFVGRVERIDCRWGGGRITELLLRLFSIKMVRLTDWPQQLISGTREDAVLEIARLYPGIVFELPMEEEGEVRAVMVVSQ